MRELRRAIVAIVDTDATIAGLTGRASDNIVAWSQIGDVGDTGVVYLIPTESQVDQDKDTREVEVQLDCFGLTLSTCELLADRLEKLLVANNFWTQGLDAAPIGFLRRFESSDLEDPSRKRKRVTVQVTINVIKP